MLDPYSAFESDLLRTAPHVINRLDRAFAGELHRCVQRATGKTAAKPLAATAPRRSELKLDLEFDDLAPVRLHHASESTSAPATAVARPTSSELLLIEDEDDASRAAIVPARQFRRLFSALESTGRSQLG